MEDLSRYHNGEKSGIINHIKTEKHRRIQAATTAAWDSAE